MDMAALKNCTRTAATWVPGSKKSQADECDKAPKTLRRHWGEGLWEIILEQHVGRGVVGRGGEVITRRDPDRTHAQERSGTLRLHFRLSRPSSPLVSKALLCHYADWER